MSRNLSIYYRTTEDGPTVDIDLRAPYYLFGARSLSVEFWRLPRLRELGLTELTQLGVIDPVYFTGWGGLVTLGREIALLQENLESIDFDVENKTKWLSHLIYAYYLLRQTAPTESTPVLMIG